jgi:hypothetical protein
VARGECCKSAHDHPSAAPGDWHQGRVHACFLQGLLGILTRQRRVNAHVRPLITMLPGVQAIALPDHL